MSHIDATSTTTLPDVLLTVDQLRDVLEALADTFPMTGEERECWIGHCINAELRGNLMQGLAFLEHHWIQRFTDGRTIFGASIETIQETPASLILDANGALGPYAGRTAVRRACEKARTSGVCAVAVRNSNDWTMISYSARVALDYDCIGIVIVNSRPEVAPWGGTTAVYGMNPFSVAIPTGRYYPILIDMSSLDTGGLRAMEHLVRGDEMPEGMFYDKDGNLVDDARAWGSYQAGWGIAGGAQRMSGYRDLALAVMMDCIGGALSGMKTAMDLGTPEPAVDGVRTPRGQFVIALSIDHFTPLAEFKAKVDRAISQAKASPLASGFAEILIPGERGFREEERRASEGIPVIGRVWAEVERLCAGRGVDVGAIVGALPTIQSPAG